MAPAVFALVLAGILLLSGIGVIAASRRTKEIDWYRCSRCNYKLEILDHQRCPECGNELDRSQLKPPTTERRSFLVAVGACLIFFGMLIGAWGAAGLAG